MTKDPSPWLSVLLLVLTLWVVDSRALAGSGHWVTTWATAPYLTEPKNLPPEPLAHKSLRQFVRTSIGAKQLRLRLCNAYGGSTTNGQDRWPDLLATRLAANPSTAKIGVANLGIGANGLLGGKAGFPSSQTRFESDILNQTGTRYFIVFMGINDIAFSGINTPAAATSRADALIAGYTGLASQARARNIKPYAATITPFGTSGTYTVTLEGIRQRVNDWIRNNTVFDGCIDFEAAVRDPAVPANLLPAYIYQNDGLHLNTDGYQAMVNAVNLNLFKP